MLTRLAILAVCALCGQAAADTYTFVGVVTQSDADASATSIDNPTLNNVADGDPFTMTLTFTGSLAGAGTFDLSTGTLAFQDPKAPASETGFNSISLTLISDGAFFDFSLQGCLPTGSACDQGNQLDANFQILASQLHSPTPTPIPISGLLPFELLEDDGVTDIHGSLGSVPEPIQIVPMSAAIGALVWYRRLNSRKRKSDQ